MVVGHFDHIPSLRRKRRPQRSALSLCIKKESEVMCLKRLTIKQQRFADEYIISGNATDAARKAGYAEKTARSIGNENLTKPDILTYIKERTAELESKKIATMKEVREFWTETMRSKYNEVKDRLKASEMIARTEGAFIDRQDIEIRGELDVNQRAEQYKKYLSAGDADDG
jgi:phage terminase small subunit